MRATNRLAIAAAAAVLIGAGSARADTFTFIPGAGPDPTMATPAGTANWNDGNNWVNTTPTPDTTGAVPDGDDVAGSSTGATTIVNTVVTPVLDVRWGNSASGNNIATVGTTSFTSVGSANMAIQAGGSLSALSNSASSANGSIRFGRAQPSTANLTITGGSLTTGFATGITPTNNAGGNFIIADLANASGASTSTFNLGGGGSGGTVNVGNDYVVANEANATGGPTVGNVNHVSGSITAVGSVVVGASGNATYNMNGGSLSTTGTQDNSSAIGRDAMFVARTAGTSTFTQSAGSVSSANGLYIANGNTANGTYTISGGSLNVAGQMFVGATTNSAGAALTTNVGRFNVVGNDAAPIAANQLNANGANSTLGFVVDDASGTSLINITAAGTFTGAANLASTTQIDLDNSGYTPVSTDVFELVRAVSISASPTLVSDGDAFDAFTLSIRDNGDGTQSLVAAVPEPASVALLGLGSLLLLRRRRA